MLFRTVLVVATIILSPILARPMPVPDTDANASSGTIEEVQDMLEGLRTVMSMGADCKSECRAESHQFAYRPITEKKKAGQTACVGQVLATCMNGKWKIASARRKRSKVVCAHIYSPPQNLD